MKTYHAAATPLSGALCGKLDVATIAYKEFVRQGNSAAWGGRDGRRCRTCLRTARIALGLR